MKRFILDSGPDKNGFIRLKEKNFHYLARVRRLSVGESFPALTPEGIKVIVKICSTDNNVLKGLCSEEIETEEKPSYPLLILLQALPKGDKMDTIVRQAAEGGITEIVPFKSQNSVSKIKLQEKFSRWQRIIKEARQQSGSSVATTIRAPMTIEELFDYWEKLKNEYPKTLGLFFHQLPLEKKSLHSYLDIRPHLAALVIGPEGGFSDIEAVKFLEAGFKPITMGDFVLRTETAALYAAAAVKIILLENESWQLKKNL